MVVVNFGTMKTLVLFAVVLGVALGAPPSTQMAIPFPDGRIIGGKTVSISDYKYQVSLLYRNSHICGATILASQWVVTAAHCTDGSSASSLSVRVGSSVRNSGGQVIAVSAIHQHPSYNSGTIDYDISILRLASAITNSNAAPIGLASSLPSTGATATITGWGTTSEGGSAANNLQMVQVPIVAASTCKSAYGSSAITDRMLCAGLTQGGKDACQGDSGGPLVVNNVLTGIVSWGYGCARPNYPGVYSSVPALRSYIKQITGL